jgi:hypothetical protein
MNQLSLQLRLLLVFFAVTFSCGCGHAGEPKVTKLDHVPDAEETEQVPDSADKIQPLLAGSLIPGIKVNTVDGKPFDLTSAIKTKPTVLIFYRGSW